MKNPREITALFEEISRSNEYKEDYVNKKVRMDRSEEELHHMYVKKKGIAAEKKEAQGEINEAKKYQNLKEEEIKSKSICNYLNYITFKKTSKNCKKIWKRNAKKWINTSNKRKRLKLRLKTKKQIWVKFPKNWPELIER
jgi:structural maintenance of chromosome 1